MANFTTATDLADGIPTMIAKEIESYWPENTFMPKLVRTDYSNELKSEGETVNIIAISELTVNDKTAGSDFDTETVTDTKTAVTLDQHKSVGIEIDDLAVMFTRPDYVKAIMAQMKAKIIEQIEGDLLALYSDVTTNSVGTAGTDATADIMVDARKKLSDSNVPLDDRYILWSTRDVAALLKIEKFTNSEWINDNASALKNASLGRRYGFDQFESQGIVTTGTSPVSTHNIAFQRAAFALVSRPMSLPDAKTGVSSAHATVEGISLRVMLSYDHIKGANILTIDTLYGVKTLREEGACIILT